MKVYLSDKYGWTEKQYENENSEEFLKLLQIKNDIDNSQKRNNP